MPVLAVAAAAVAVVAVATAATAAPALPAGISSTLLTARVTMATMDNIVFRPGVCGAGSWAGGGAVGRRIMGSSGWIWPTLTVLDGSASILRTNHNACQSLNVRTGRGRSGGLLGTGLWKSMPPTM